MSTIAEDFDLITAAASRLRQLAEYMPGKAEKQVADVADVLVSAVRAIKRKLDPKGKILV